MMNTGIDNQGPTGQELEEEVIAAREARVEWAQRLSDMVESVRETCSQLKTELRDLEHYFTSVLRDGGE